jgi:hypothetical protein
MEMELPGGVGVRPRMTGGERRVAAPARLRSDLAAATTDRVTLTWQLCVDPGGWVVEVKAKPPSEPPSEIAAGYAAAIHRWTFTPFVLDGTPRRACGEAVVVQRRDAADAELELRDYWFVRAQDGSGGERTAGDGEIHLPEGALNTAVGLKISRWDIRVRVCRDERGVPTTIAVMQPLQPPPWLAELFASRIRDWRFAPFVLHGKPVPICTLREFRYIIE